MISKSSRKKKTWTPTEGRVLKRLTFSQLINLEIQLAKDAEADPVAIRRRDRSIGKQLDHTNLSRPELFERWLRLIGNQSAFKPGQMYAMGMRILSYVLVILGLISGISAASAILHYDGSQPVNIVNFLAFFIGSQLLLYLFFCLNLLPDRMKIFLPFLGDLYDLLRQVGMLLTKAVSRLNDRDMRQFTRHFSERLRNIRLRQQFYLNIEKWLFISKTQLFSIAFNIGALLTCLYLIIFSDLAFAWNTTLDFPNSNFHKMTTIISKPWQHFAPEAVPSLALIENTRFSRLEGAYVRASEAKRAPELNPGDWWPFLTCALFFYGLVPRLIIFFMANWRLRANLGNVSLKTAQFAALYERLTMPMVQTTSPVKNESLPTNPSRSVRNQPGQIKYSGVGKVVLWGEFQLPQAQLERLILERFSCESWTAFEAGMFDNTNDATIPEKIAANLSVHTLVLILVESWETPGKAIIHFLKKLRKVLAENHEIVIGLVNTLDQSVVPDVEDWQAWQTAIIQVGDPYCRVVAMAEELV